MLFSRNLDKYEYLTGEDLNYKPSTSEQAKYYYCSLGKVFNKGLKEKHKKKGLLKRLKYIEHKNEERLKEIKSKNENIKEVIEFVNDPLSLEAKALIEKIRNIQRDDDYRKLKNAGGNKNTYDFSDYKTLKELFRDPYYRNMTTDETKKKQDKYDGVFGALSA